VALIASSVKDDHLLGGMVFASTAAEAMGISSKSAIDWIGLNVAVAILWFEDRVDHGGESASPEKDQAAAFTLLSRYIEEFGASPPTRILWTKTFRDTTSAIAGPAPRTYLEHLETGARSIGFAHCMATLALASGLDISERTADPNVQFAIDLFARAARLENDLHGLARERWETNCANAVLLLQPTLQSAAARFVRMEVERYRATAEHVVGRLTPGDPLVRLIRSTLAGAAAFYRERTLRFPVAPCSSSAE
jgi:hypothetical protein